MSFIDFMVSFYNYLCEDSHVQVMGFIMFHLIHINYIFYC